MRTLVVVVLFVTLAFAGCTTGSSFETIPSADWKPGYTFGFTLAASNDSHIDATFNGEPSKENGDHHNAVGPVPWATYKVASTQIKDGNVPMYLALANMGNARLSADLGGDVTLVGVPGSAVPNGLLGFRQSDLQTQYTKATTTRNCGTCERTSSIEFKNDGDDYSYIRFPLAYGDSWTADVPSGELGDTPGLGVHGESLVNGMESVAGPYGQVDAVRVENQMSLTGTEGVRDAMAGEAAQYGVTINALDLSVSGTVEVFFAPSLHAVVRQTSTTTTTMHFDVESAKGHEVADFTSTSTFTLNLAAVSLTVGPELTLDQAIAALGQPLQLPDPPKPDEVTPTAPAPSPVALTLEAEKQVVNAADSTAVGFHTTVSGDGLDKSALTYSISGADRKVVKEGVGGDFSFVFDTPGYYFVRVDGKDTSGRPASAVTNIVANYESDVPAVCPVVALSLINRCDAISVPVRPGIQSLTITAKRTPIIGESEAGYLKVTPPAGDYWQSPMSSNEAVVEVTEFPTGTVTHGDWTAQFSPTVAVQDNVHYVVNLQFGPGGAAEAFTDDGVVAGMPLLSNFLDSASPVFGLQLPRLA